MRRVLFQKSSFSGLLCAAVLELAGLLMPIPLWGHAALPLPRFVSLRSTEVNGRIGPGTEYPAKWTYLRYLLPIKVLKEHDVWRFIEDHEGVKSWIHQSMLSGLRTLMIVGDNNVALRTKPDYVAPAMAKAESGVIGYMAKVEQNWCQLKINRDYYWVPRTHVWGLLDSE